MKLRIKNDVQVPEAVRHAVSDLLGKYEEVTYTQQRDVTESFKARAQSLLNAFCFATDAYPPDLPWSQGQGDALKQLAKYKFNQIDWGNQAASTYLDQQLADFTNQLINILAQNWSWSASKKLELAAHFLNEAEQYELMPQGRDAKATLVPVKSPDKTVWALLIDKPKNAWLPERLSEMEDVRKQGCPDTPDWYLKRSESTQIYLTSIKRDIIDVDALHAELNNFNIKFRLHGCSTTIADELKKIKLQTEAYPEWYNGASVEIKALIRHLVDKPHEEQLKALEQVRNELIELKNARADTVNQEIKLVASLPRWYLALPKHHLAFLRHIFKDSRPTAELISFLSSRLRELPAQANFREHQLVMINDKGERVETPVRLAAANPASRRLLDRPLNEQWAHVDDNLKLILSQGQQGQSALIATNITPIPGIGIPDPYLAALTNEAIQRLGQEDGLFYINNSLNIGRVLCYTSSYDSVWLKLIEKAKTYNNDNLNSLIQLAEDTLNAGPGRSTVWDYNRRELYLSSLAHLLIIQMDGLSFGCCISGKDRKAIELIHTDAMLIYKEIYGSWPSYYDGMAVGFGMSVDPKSEIRREQFVDIVAELYISRHQQVLAGDNAPGCDALKTPDTYWPADIAEAIAVKLNRADTHEVEECIAKNNDVDKIVKATGFNPNIWPALPPEKRLAACGREQAQAFLDALAALFNENWLFIPSGERSLFASCGLPSGIDAAFRKLQRAAKNERNQYQHPCDLLKDICQLIISRPVTGTDRTKTTNEVYTMLSWLSDGNINGCTSRLNEIKTEAYEQNRKITKSASYPGFSQLFSGFS